MLNASGATVGILTFKLQGTENLNFVVPINYARGLISSKDSMSLGDLRERLGKTTDVFKEKDASFPREWKSLTAGNTIILRLEGEHLYVETILPDENQKVGDFILADLMKTDGKYVGTVRNRLTCRTWYVWFREYAYNTCVEEDPIEITVLTATRIEGWAQAYPEDKKFKCEECTHSNQRIRMGFVWIPK
jgi:hypothetical protein